MKKGQRAITKSSCVAHPREPMLRYKYDGVLTNPGTEGIVFTADNKKRKAFVQLPGGFAWFSFAELTPL